MKYSQAHKILEELVLLLMAIALPIAALAQAGAGGDKSQLLQKLKESAAENRQKLRQYTWLETQQVTLKGEAKPPRAFNAQYGPDGRVQKTPVGPPPQPQGGQGGKLKQRIVAKKTEEMKDYMQEVQGVVSLYVPPDPQRMQQAYQAGNVSINSTLGSNQAELVFKNYAQPGDQMTITFDSRSRKIQSLNVNSYLDDAKNAITLAVQFASLSDGTNYPQQTVLDAKAKQLQVTTTNSNYAKLGQ
jgi:hypothetical protein